MRKYARKNRYGNAIVKTALLLVAVAPVSKAFAQNPFDDQWANYQLEHFLSDEGIPDPLMARGTLAEARNQGQVLMQVWRGATNNQVWIAIAGGTAFTFGNTATLVSPTVVPYGTSQFRIFHVGTDDHIYYTTMTSAGTSVEGQWIQVPNQTTQQPVSVTQYGTDPTDLYMVYLSSSGDGRVYGTWLDNNENNWHFSGNLAGGQALSAPSITYNTRSQALWVVAEGLDGQIINTMNLLGSPTWDEWEENGVQTNGAPTIASGSVLDAPTDGAMIIAYRDANRTVHFELTDEFLEGIAGAIDNTGWQTNDTVGLTITNDQIFDRFTGLNGSVYYKYVANAK